MVLSRPEVAALLAHPFNLKHRAWLTLIYDSGLRVSEAAAMKTAHIDSSALRVFVQGGKGHKDRSTILSQAALLALREYWRMDRPTHPAGWLFPGPGPTGPVTPASIQQAFGHAASVRCRFALRCPSTVRYMP